MATKTAWTYFLRDDGLVFRTFRGLVQYFVLDTWHDSAKYGVDQIVAPTFKQITKREADIIKKS